ncbi:NPP1 family protein [Spongiactinospora sp. 9N601]|uniref:NPP1 family protein n=1 Tax=Spongiactinospora sp. 9N601 TaxID=3375149 RepID=UPI003788CF02
MTLIAALGIAGAASPAWAEPPPPEIKENASAANLRFQPAMDYDEDGCYASVAIGPDGTLTPGLPLGGALNGACRDASDLDNSNMYARSRCNTNGWCAHMYDLYFQKDQTTQPGCDVCGHTHDWEHIIVWTKDDKPEYVATSLHGNYDIKKATEVEFHDGTHPKIVYHKDGGFTHGFRFADSRHPLQNHYRRWHLPDLVSWEGYPSTGVRDTLAGHNWGKATFGLKDQDDTFRKNVEEAHKDLPFDFNPAEHRLPAGMSDPNLPPPAREIRVMGLGSSSVVGEGSTHGNGFRADADRGFGEIADRNAGVPNPGSDASTPRVDWVGSRRVGTMADREMEGWGGRVISEIAGKASCPVRTYQPNLITLLAGGNDVIYDQMDGAIGRLENLIKQVMTDAPGVTVLVAGMQPFHDAARNARGEAFTAQISDLVKRLAEDGLHVVYADTTGLDRADVGSDGIHATDAGYRKIADAFVKAARQANDRKWILPPNAQAPNAGSHPCGMEDLGSGAEEVEETNPNKLGPNWDDRGVIQDVQYPSSTRFMMVDINKDRKAEFVTVDKDQNVRFWWNSGPSGRKWVPFVEGTHSIKPDPGAIGNQLRFGDVDGDGFPDCMIVDLTGRIFVRTWKGENPAGSRMCMKKYDGIASVFSNGSTGDRLKTDPATKIRFADVTGGGRDDYLLIQPDGTTTAWYNRDFQNKDGRKWLDWTPPQNISRALKLPREIRYADINGDKRADRVLITANGGARAWINEGAKGAGGKLRDIGRIAGDADVPPKDVQIADIDGDGKADFLRIGWTGVTHAWLNRLPANYFDTFHP